MRIGAFQLSDNIPELYEPHAFAILRPWINVGSVGSSVLEILESNFNAQPLGQLLRPGNFIDFTRYRPVTCTVGGKRIVTVPNTYIDFAKSKYGNDLVFFNMLEPHMFGEVYVNSILKIIQMLGIKRYCLIGGMYDSVPHTKPLIISGTSEGEIGEKLRRLGVQTGNYEGPTTIVSLISQKAIEQNIELITLIIHLPQYTELDIDYAGQLRLLEVICSLYNFPIDLDSIRNQANKQYTQLSEAMELEPQLKNTVKQLEQLYESKITKSNEEMPKLSPEIEEFLHDIDKGFNNK